jgi:beta-fructofuranosidase
MEQPHQLNSAGISTVRPSGFAPAHGYLWDPWFVWDDSHLHLFYLLQRTPVGYDREYVMPRDRPVIAHAGWSAGSGWIECPLALDYTGTPYDAERIHTGSIVRRGSEWYMFYSGSGRFVCLAVSRDLLHWQKSRSNPILTPDPRWYGAHWRDPWLFRDPSDHRYTMLLAAQSPKADGLVGVARSTDLSEWEQEDPLDIPPWFEWLEVPEPHHINDSWYLLFVTRKRWISAAGRAHFQAHGIPAEDGAFYLRAESWRGPYREVHRLFPPGDPRYTTRLVTTPNGERWLWSHVELDEAGRPLFELAAPLACAVSDGLLLGRPFTDSMALTE